MPDDSDGPRPVLDSSESPVMKRKTRKRRAIVDSDSEGEGETVGSGKGRGVEEEEEGKRKYPKEDESSDGGADITVCLIPILPTQPGKEARVLKLKPAP